MGKRKRDAPASPSPSRSAASSLRGDSLSGPSSDSRGGDGSSSDDDSQAWAAFDAEVQAAMAQDAARAESPPLSPQGAATPATRAAPRLVDAAAAQRPSQSGSAFASLPPELLRRVLRWLSAEDLSAAGATCCALRRAASEAEPWRRLYRLRWPAAGEPEPADWRAALRERDAEELRAVEAGPLAEIYRQQLIARRAQAPTAAALAADEAAAAAAAGAVPAALAAWRRRNWASAVATTAPDDAAGAASQNGGGSSSQNGGEAATHRCSARCAFAPLPLPAGAAPVWLCVASGRPHGCDDACREERRGGGGEVTVLCAVTGAVRQQYFEDAEEEDAARAGDAAAAAADDDAAAFLPGSFGRAYAVGYECASEAELRAAMWGGAAAGSCGGSATRRRRFTKEE